MLEVDSNGTPSTVPSCVLNEAGECGTMNCPPPETVCGSPCGTRGSFRFSKPVPEMLNQDGSVPPLNSQNGLPCHLVSEETFPCR